jgi:hypothetical protein
MELGAEAGGGEREGEGWGLIGKPRGAFTRFVGYRSRFYLVPCWAIDFWVIVWYLYMYIVFFWNLVPYAADFAAFVFG